VEQEKRLTTTISPVGLAAFAFAAVAVFGSTASGEDLHQVVSLEDPSFDVAESRLAIGRDGRVYIGSSRYVLGVKPDGSDKLGSPVTGAVRMVTANANGVVATANAHFNHSVKLWTSAFQPLGSVSDFLVNDQVQWQSPTDVEAGPSGDFYGLDPNRNRIVRIAPPGRIVTTYALDQLGDFSGKEAQLRVSEKGKRFFVLSSGVLQAMAFDGRPLWSLPMRVTYSDGWRGGFDVADDGRIFVLEDTSDTVQVYDAEGRFTGRLHLQMGQRKSRVSDLRVLRGDVLLKRPDPRELFQVYDGLSGALKRAVLAETEELDVTLPDDPLIAGASVPLRIRFVSARRTQPRWRAWLRPFGVPWFEEVPLRDGQLVLPADAGGLYQLRISAGDEGARGPFAVEKIIEIRSPQSRGAVSVYTPESRLYFGAGEAIPVFVVARTPIVAPDRALLRLTRGSHVVAESDVVLPAGAPAQIVLRPELTRALLPGRYMLTAEIPRFTSAAQALEIGPGIEAPPLFSIVQHGDYTPSLPTGTVFDAPEKVAARLDRARKLGINMFADRLDAGTVEAKLTADDLLARLKSDPGATAPEKATLEGIARDAVAGFGANGIEQRAILLGNDAGLPPGTGYDTRTHQQLADSITRVTTSLSTYPAFRGWSWAANWWIDKVGADAAAGPEEKAAYASALEKAISSGVWSPVLDAVSDRMLAQAVQAEQEFRGVLQKVAPGKLSVMTGPYRALGVLPPVTFRNADEVDLHFQSEQIQPPDVTSHNVDFYKRPGKRAWGHPELWNDDGTGGMILPTLFQMLMRGADGVGWAGEPPWWGPFPDDPRASGPGTLSILRGLGRLLHDYGPWLTSLHGADRVAIVVSSRMIRIDRWGRLGGDYFDRLYEAYGTCLYAHRPAAFVFAEDATPETLKAFRAVLIVEQRVDLEPRLLDALVAARAAGVGVFYDGTSRLDVVTPFRPLGLGFYQMSQDPTPWQDDSAYLRIPGYFEKHAERLKQALGASVPPVAEVDSPGILLTERSSGEGRFVWVVGNVEPDLDPGLAWRTGNILSQRMPLAVPVGLNAGPDAAIYDVFGMSRLQTNGRVEADLRSLPARLFAILPHAIDAVQIDAPGAVDVGREYSWTVSVLDGRGRRIEANIPLRVELIASDGTVLREQTLFTRSGQAASARWTMPLDPPAGRLSLRAVELISGKAATLSVIPIVPTGPRNLVDIPSGHLRWDSGQERSVVGRNSDAGSPAEQSFGPHLKDVAISPQGDLAVFNAMNWDENLYALDLASGGVRWRRRVANHFTYAPQSTARGFAVEAFDRMTAEGYHLYLLDRDGNPERRFALYGLPKRATNWAMGGVLLDRVDAFAASPDGDWVASAGDLGLVVWDRDGKHLWGLDWWRSARRRVIPLALNRDTLVALEGTTVTAYDARDGQLRWTLHLARSGTLQGAVAGSDGATLAVRSDVTGGRVFVIRGGRLVSTIASAADDLALSNDGESLGVTTGDQLNWYSVKDGLVWSFTGDGVLHRPRIDADGRRIVVGSEIGTIYVLSALGQSLWHRDCGALPIGTWLPGGDLLVGTWMGVVERRDRRYESIWSTHLTPETRDIRGSLLAADPTPSSRVASWGNAATVSSPLSPNLLSETRALVNATLNDRQQEWENPIESLTDGKPDAPDKPWLTWTTIGSIDSGWVGHLSLNVDAFRSELRVTGVTFVEDPAHPESWVRDVRMQYWDASEEVWRDGPYFLSNAPTHTHWLEKPIEAARFRFVTTGGGTWPVGNIRLGELVFHGRVLGSSHPDVLSGRPVAVLFDENEGIAKSLLGGPGRPIAIVYGDAYSGGKSLALTSSGITCPQHEPTFGHALPDWDFEIVEHPKAGQYRWLQFAWKALSPQTKIMSLLIGGAWPEGGYALDAGAQPWPEGVLADKKVAEAPPPDWQVVRVDLWDLYRHPLRVRALCLAASGGGAAFDRILLGRTKEDLERTR
jgi:hypothetical protein